MNAKTKIKLIRLFSIIMILFGCLNIFSILFPNKSEALVFSTAIGTGLTVAGISLLILNALKLIVLVIGLIGQAIISGIYSSVEQDLSWAGLQDIIFAGANGCSKFLDVNFFDFSGGEESTMVVFRVAIAKWYYIMRLIAATVLLVILIYVGIRMALSTIASEQAKYKQMLVDWVTSIALLFLLHYIIIFIVTVNNSIVSALYSVYTEGENIATVLQAAAISEIGPGGLFAAIVFVLYIGQMFSFFLIYMKRMITVGFLIMIAPLITITYAIDKMGDGKAQALNAWLKEMIYNILIQPFYCILFLAFFGAIDMMLENDSSSIGPYIMAIILVSFMKKAEEILKKIFHFEASSMSSMGEAAQTMANMKGKFTQVGMAAGTLGYKAVTGIKTANNNAKELRNTLKANKEVKKDWQKLNANGTKADFERYIKSEDGQKALQAKKSQIKAKDMAKVAQSNREKRKEKKVDKALKDNETYKELKQKADNGDEGAKKEVAKMRADKAKELDENKDSKKKRIGKAVGTVGQGVKRFTQSETGKALGNFAKQTGSLAWEGFKDSTKVATAIGMGALAFGATGEINDAISGGQFGYGLTKGFLENTTRTVTNDTSELMETYMKHMGITDPNEISKILNNIKNEDATGKYDSKQMEAQFDSLMKQLTNALGGGTDAKHDAEAVIRSIKDGIWNSDVELDVDKIIDSLDLDDESEKAKILDEANRYTQNLMESRFAAYIKQGEGFNMDADELGSRVTNKISKVYTVNNYSEENNYYNQENNFYDNTNPQ